MSDERWCIFTPEGAYLQDEDGQGWTLIPRTEEYEYVRHRLTNEEVEQFIQYEINMAKLREAVGALVVGLGEVIRALHQAFQDFANAVSPSVQETRELLRELADETEEEEPRKTQRPDYGARPKCHTHAKTRRDRKQRSRER